MELRELPVFAGYVFCQFDPLRRLPIITTPGVLHIVGLGKTPLPVENSEIQALQHITRAGLALQACDYLKVGNRVRIEEGPLKGVEGILIDKRNSRRLVVSVTLLKRSVAVEVGCESVSMLESEGSGRIIDVMLSGSDSPSSNRLELR
jgi:transcription antitermination factor NusG